MVAVDGARTPPQVDPILGTRRNQPAAAKSLLGDDLVRPARAYCGTYWVDNLRHTVRFAAAVQAASSYRVFTSDPHPLLTHAVGRAAQPRHVTAAPGRLCATEGNRARHAQPATSPPAPPSRLRGATAGRRSARAHLEPSSAARRRPSHHAHANTVAGTIAGLPRAPARGPERHVRQGRWALRDNPGPADHRPRRGPAFRSRLLRKMALAQPADPSAKPRNLRHRFRKRMLLLDATNFGVTATVEAPALSHSQ